jgi:hypothetical protein
VRRKLKQTNGKAERLENVVMKTIENWNVNEDAKTCRDFHMNNWPNLLTVDVV